MDDWVIVGEDGTSEEKNKTDESVRREKQTLNDSAIDTTITPTENVNIQSHNFVLIAAVLIYFILVAAVPSFLSSVASGGTHTTVIVSIPTRTFQKLKMLKPQVRLLPTLSKLRLQQHRNVSLLATARTKYLAKRRADVSHSQHVSLLSQCLRFPLICPPLRKCLDAPQEQHDAIVPSYSFIEQHSATNVSMCQKLLNIHCGSCIEAGKMLCGLKTLKKNAISNTVALPFRNKSLHYPRRNKQVVSTPASSFNLDHLLLVRQSPKPAIVTINLVKSSMLQYIVPTPIHSKAIALRNSERALVRMSKTCAARKSQLLVSAVHAHVSPKGENECLKNASKQP